MQNYFELFDLKTSFFVDDEALKKSLPGTSYKVSS